MQCTPRDSNQLWWLNMVVFKPTLFIYSYRRQFLFIFKISSHESKIMAAHVMLNMEWSTTMQLNNVMILPSDGKSLNVGWVALSTLGTMLLVLHPNCHQFGPPCDDLLLLESAPNHRLFSTTRVRQHVNTNCMNRFILQHINTNCANRFFLRQVNTNCAN